MQNSHVFLDSTCEVRNSKYVNWTVVGGQGAWNNFIIAGLYIKDTVRLPLLPLIALSQYIGNYYFSAALSLYKRRFIHSLSSALIPSAVINNKSSLILIQTEAAAIFIMNVSGRPMVPSKNQIISQCGMRR
jgi:hypothetical protein